MLPYQVGRLKYHADVYGRGDRFAGERMAKAPADYLRRFWFDTVVHEPAALRLLIDVMGEDKVVLGSNYPGSEWYQRAYKLVARHVPQTAPQS